MVNNPTIRFKGFSDEWVKRKLGDVLTRAHRPTVGRNLVTVGENQTTLRTQENQGYNSKLTDIDMTKYAGINFGDVLVDLSSYSRGFYISTMDGLTSKAYHVLSHDFKEYRLIFLKYILVNRQILKQLPGITPIGARQGKSLPVDDVLNLKVSLPSEDEQQKIGSIFSTLDHKIGLEERQILLLKDLKKGYLQKMFPKNGAKVPELRFAGFADDWEERKLEEVANFFDEKRIPIDSGKRISGKYPYYGATGIIDYVDDYIFDGEYVLLAEDGANIMMRNSPIAYITTGKFWLNNHAHIMKIVEGSNNFLLQILENQNYEKFNSGTAQPKLNGKVVKGLYFYFPSTEEQQKIGSFFKQLDDTIALHKRKLDLLKDLKKGLLQQMFV